MKKDENNKIKTKTKQKIKENRMKKKKQYCFFFRLAATSVSFQMFQKWTD